MIEIINPKTQLSKLVPINGLTQRDITKMFSVYNRAGYQIRFKGE